MLTCSHCVSRKTRTCIHTPGYPPLEPNELSQSSLCSALDGARLVYFDVRLHETAIVVAEEVIITSVLAYDVRLHFRV